MKQGVSVAAFITVLLEIMVIFQPTTTYAYDNSLLKYQQEVRQKSEDSTAPIALDEKETFKMEITKLKEQVQNLPTDNIAKFKGELDKAIVSLISKSLPLLPGAEKEDVNYKMTEFRNKINNDKDLLPEVAKKSFIYETEQIQNLILGTQNKAIIKSSVKTENKDIDLETYNKLLQELNNIGKVNNSGQNKFNVGGEIRFHSSGNRGIGRLNDDQAGLRTRIGIDAYLAKDWRAYGMFELKTDIHDYDDVEEFNRFYVKGKLGKTGVTAGAFGYLMAEGNVYDSRFDGLKFEFGQQIKYALAYGETNSSKDTFVSTAKYSDLDYDLELGIYSYRAEETDRKNTITSLGYNYYFSNFSVGAMYLKSNWQDVRGDDDGYVLGIKYGDLKTFRPKTYDIFAKYYNQAQGTYIAHGMNGIGTRMQGFKGYAVGTHYTLVENVVLGLEYFNLEDKVTGLRGKTLWGSVTYYF